MSLPQDFLTTQAFAEKAGVSAGTVSKWIRSGKIDGKKKNGKWIIAENEISKVSKPTPKKSKTATPAKSMPVSRKAASPSDASAYSVEAFSKMTYLTAYGVGLWLKTGRLISTVDDSGKQAVDGASLDLPHIKPLLR